MEKTLTSQERESFFDTDSLILSGKRLKEGAEVNRENPGVPITETRTSLPSPKSDIPHSAAPVPEANVGSVLIPSNGKPHRDVGTLSRGHNFPRVPAQIGRAHV